MLDSTWFLSVYVGKYVEQIANNSWVKVVICVMGAVHTHLQTHTRTKTHTHTLWLPAADKKNELSESIVR